MSKVIHSNYRLNITSFATLSGLSLAIYRSNFMKDYFKLPMLTGTGDTRVTDVIIPRGENLYYYDVNSLYPTAMLLPMPTGNPIYSTIKDLSKIFGFTLATVTTPGDNIPILPFKKSDGTLIFPNGTWTGWFFYEELKQAVESYGYKAEIHESYIFERGFDIFKEYVETMAEIKQNSKGATRKIHKLLMNSLYGRMGMNNEPEKIKVLNSEEIRNIHMSYQVIENLLPREGFEYIRYLAFPDPELCAQSGIDYIKLSAANDHVRKEILSSSPIAAATTAYARMFMNPIKFIHDNKFYYGDTDSGVLQKPLSKRMVGNLLGQFKLEYSGIKEAIFAAPKLYFLQLDNGEIIAKGKGYSGTLSVVDYYQLYEGKFIEVLDKRWFKNLQLNTINVSERILKISPIFNKRNKLYSLGKWVDTSPLWVNPG